MPKLLTGAFVAVTPWICSGRENETRITRNSTKMWISRIFQPKWRWYSSRKEVVTSTVLKKLRWKVKTKAQEGRSSLAFLQPKQFSADFGSIFQCHTNYIEVKFFLCPIFLAYLTKYCEMLKIQHCYAFGSQMAVWLLALRTRRTLLPRNIILMFLVLFSVIGWVNPRA
jgi:hypothetical protein